MLLPLQILNLLETGAATASIGGTSLTEAQIVAGGQEITITLTNDTWIADITAQRQAIIDGLDSAQSELLGWNNEVRDKEVVGAVVRTSDTVVTITLSAAIYDITADETITVTIPASALTGAVELTGSPTVEVTADAVVTDVTAPSGGWDFMMKFEDFREKREKDKSEREKVREEIEAIKDETDREIAQILQKDLALESREKELKDLEFLVATTFRNEDIEKAKAHSERVAKAFVRAAVQSNRSAVEALEREMDRAREEDEFLLIAMMVL